MPKFRQDFQAGNPGWNFMQDFQAGIQAGNSGILQKLAEIAL